MCGSAVKFGRGFQKRSLKGVKMSPGRQDWDGNLNVQALAGVHEQDVLLGYLQHGHIVFQVTTADHSLGLYFQRTRL